MPPVDVEPGVIARPARAPWMVAMSRLLRTGLLVASLVGLSGCFESDEPLIDFARSSTPLTEGRYTYADGSATKTATIRNEGLWTEMTSFRDDGSRQVQRLLLYDLHQKFFLVMDPMNHYAIIHVDGRTVLEYNTTRYCDDYLDLQRSGRAIPQFDAMRVVDGVTSNSHACKFYSLYGLLSAAVALIENNRIVVSRTYQRQ